MSQQAVGITITRLLTDEDFRDRFVLDPLETIADLHLEGVELTLEEIGAFVQADIRMWSWTASFLRARVH
jgi:hypothetical protein